MSHNTVLSKELTRSTICLKISTYGLLMVSYYEYKTLTNMPKRLSLSEFDIF